MIVAVPLTLREAYPFIQEHHRHHRPPQGGLFAVGCAVFDRETSTLGPVVGVAIVGRPVSRILAQDPWLAEVTRLTTDGTLHACSFLYAASWRAARALGYRKLVTYTLATEAGASLRGAGWLCVGEAGGGSWSRKCRPRVDAHPTQAKLRWEVAT